LVLGECQCFRPTQLWIGALERWLTVLVEAGEDIHPIYPQPDMTPSLFAPRLGGGEKSDD
jgi:hypothetical protein